MANTIKFETEKEDGSWKLWRNVVIPVKYGNILDEQLDYAVVTLARVKRKLFKPLTKAKLTVTSETEHGGVQPQTMVYFIANNDAFETPIGSKAYNHELTLIELTKFLECFQLESLCFTNPNGNAYTKAAAAPVLSVTTGTEKGEDYLRHIDEEKFDKTYKTPSAIGTIYGLPDLYGDGYQKPFTGYAIVTIKNKNTEGDEITYNSNDYKFGSEFHNATFEIAKGENIIEYKYMPENVLNEPYGYQTFTIYGVENKYPLKPWTVNDVIQRILQLVEPIRVNQKPRFTFTPPTDKKARLFEQLAPEFTFTRMTLREALQAVGGFIHAEPRLNENNEIEWDYYGEQVQAKIHNYKTDEDKDICKTKYRAQQSAFGVDQACTRLDSYQQNLVNRVDWEIGTTEQPYSGGAQTLRTETAYMRGEEEISFFFPTQQGVDRVVKFEYISEEKDENGKYKTFDITPYIFEEKVYGNLSSYSAVYPSSKSFALYYTQSGKGINGFFYKVPSEHGGTVGKEYSIVNILNTCGAKIPKDDDDKNAYDKMKFRLSYVPIYSTRVQQSKPYLNEYLPLPRVLNYTQTDNSVEARFFGENIKGAVARMGNPEKTYTINLRNLNNIPKAGQLWDNDYYIASVSVAVNQDLFEVSVGLSKNFNRKSQYIGASSIKRIYEVSEEMTQQRHTIYTDYMVLTKDIDGLFLLKDDSVLLQESGIMAIPSMFNGGKYFSYNEISCVVAQGLTYNGSREKQVLLPVISSAFGNVMEFTWEYKDNFSAGLQNVEPTVGEIKGSFGQEVNYADYYGRLWSYQFTLLSNVQLSEFGNVEAVKAEELPEAKEFNVNTSRCYVSTSKDVDTSMLERKDSREALKKTYAVEFVTDEPTFVIGSAFANKSPLVYSQPLEWNVPRLYILPERINKFATHIDLSELKDEDRHTDTHDVVPTYSSVPVPHFKVPGVVAKKGGKAWAYVVPQSIKEVMVEDEKGVVDKVFIPTGGELIIGENIDIKAGQIIGEFHGLAVHDVFKYLKARGTKQLSPPSISIEGSTITINASDDRTEKFAVIVNGKEVATVQAGYNTKYNKR